MAAGPIQSAIAAMITTMDSSAMTKSSIGATEPTGSFYEQIKSAFPQEAQMLRDGWRLIRSALDSALSKATSAKL